MTDLIQRCKDYATECHAETNHYYNGKPYSFHLHMVNDYANKYLHLCFDQHKELALASAWTHDVIEDCRQTYNDVKQNCGEEVAEITFALTNEKGKNRKERANDKYYEGIKKYPAAHFIKICDRLANIKYSFDNNHRMIDAYRKEDSDFAGQLYDFHYREMFDEMDKLLFTHKITESTSSV